MKHLDILLGLRKNNQNDLGNPEAGRDPDAGATAERAAPADADAGRQAKERPEAGAAELTHVAQAILEARADPGLQDFRQRERDPYSASAKCRSHRSDTCRASPGDRR